MAQVSVNGLVKDYGRLRVIPGLTFDVADGEFVALVGPSGCGKSTLLRMIAGLEDISGGTVSIAGRVVNAVEPKERDIAMVFQNYALYPHMSVRENMGFSLKLRGGDRAVLAQRVAETAAVLGLSDLLDRKPGQLSGGQRQRVAMGRAIVRQPSVFLFDEPLSNLDAALRVQMRGEIRALHDRLGSTSMFVTHDQVEAMTMADRIVVLRAGQLEQAGAPLDLYDRPANVFVAGFIGSPAMNLVDCRGASAFPGIGLPPAATGRDVIWGIRPEDMDLVSPGDAGAVDGTVTTLETAGATQFIRVETGGAALTALFSERHDLARGDRVALRPREGKSHLFDAATGARIDG